MAFRLKTASLIDFRLHELENTLFHDSAVLSYCLLSMKLAAKRGANSFAFFKRRASAVNLQYFQFSCTISSKIALRK